MPPALRPGLVDRLRFACPLWTQVLWVQVPVPVPLLLSDPLWLHLLAHLYLCPHQPDAVAWGPAELGEGSAPKEMGVHAGPSPLAHPPFQGKEGPRL